MKFKNNATEKALYKLLGLGAVLAYIQGAFLFIIGVGLVIESSKDPEQWVAVAYAVAGLVVLGIGEFLRTIRKEMVED